MDLKQYIRNPTSLLLIVLVIMAGGIISLISLPIKMYPDMVKPTYMVGFSHGDIVSPADIYKTYGRGFEQQLRGLDGVENVTARYSRGRGRYSVEFEWDIDDKEIQQDIERIFQQAAASSNNRLRHYSHSRSARSTGYMRVSFGSKSLSKSELGEVLFSGLKPILEAIEGVKSVWIGGRIQPKKLLEVDLEKLLRYGIDLSQLENTVKKSIQSKTAGSIESKGGNEVQITIPAPSSHLEDVINQTITHDIEKDQIVRIRDVAKIVERLEPDNRISRLNGVDGSFMYVSLESNGDVKRACDEVQVKFEEFKKSHPEISYSITVNPSNFIQNAIQNLVSNAFIGGLVAIIVIFVFLGTFGNTVIISISIPFCIIGSFLLMKFYGVTLNIVSLGGLAIGVGMIVDSSIVALENIYRRLLLIKDIDDPESKSAEIIAATKEVAMPIAASILTSIVVFFPILYTKSYSKAVLGDLARAVMFVIATSSLSALFIVPGLSYRFMKKKKAAKKQSENQPAENQNFLLRNYDGYLNWALKGKVRAFLIVGLAATIFGGTLFLTPFIKKEIIAQPNSSLAEFHIELPENDKLEIAKKYASMAETWLGNREEVLSHSTQFWNPDRGTVTARLKDRAMYDKVKEEFLNEFDATPEAVFTVSYYNPGAMPLPRVYDLIVDISGSKEQQLSRTAKEIEQILKAAPGRTQKRPRTSHSEGIEINFKDWITKQEDLRRYIQAAGTDGYWFTNIVENGDQKEVKLAFRADQQATTLEALRSFPLTYNHKIVPLKAVADIRHQSDSYIPLQFINGSQKQQVFYTSRAPGPKKAALVSSMRKKIENLDRSSGVIIGFPDSQKEVNTAFDSFRWALIISIMLVFVIIAVMFNSLKYPLIILVTVPFSLVGVITGLWAVDSTISLNSMLGVILLSGLVVNNGILLLDFYKRQKLNLVSSSDKISAIKEACKMRMRPILMTTLTTLFGALPIALAFGEGGKILQPLGVAVFFGLLTSTSMTLFVVPCLIKIFDSKSELAPESS